MRCVPTSSTSTNVITILGGGLAGSSAAITVLARGEAAGVIEKSRFPRHKVCGEFLSPECHPILDRLGVSTQGAAPIRRVQLQFARRSKGFRLPQPALGLSRYALDDRMMARAESLGAQRIPSTEHPAILAHGRRDRAERGSRLFGFKAHYDGPINDAVELYFFDGGYVGVNPVEGGQTNVCGLLPEPVLRRRNFEMDGILHAFPPLAERLSPLRRAMDWLRAGPLVFDKKTEMDHPAYPAGDALCFVDPFTGSGMLSALVTGSISGSSALEQVGLDAHLRACDKAIHRSFAMSSLMRSALGSSWAELLIPFVPGAVLFRLTRPGLS
jgi:flavin-dependent dehydrogenase